MWESRTNGTSIPFLSSSLNSFAASEKLFAVCPAVLPSSGSLLGPKIKAATPAMTAISGMPSPNSPCLHVGTFHHANLNCGEHAASWCQNTLSNAAKSLPIATWLPASMAEQQCTWVSTWTLLVTEHSRTQPRAQKAAAT